MRIRIHLQHNTGLHIGAESGLGNFHPIRSDRKAGQNIGAIRASGGVADQPGVGLGDFDLGIGYSRARGILNGSHNLRYRCDLSPKSGNSRHTKQRHNRQ